MVLYANIVVFQVYNTKQVYVLFLITRICMKIRYNLRRGGMVDIFREQRILQG